VEITDTKREDVASADVVLDIKVAKPVEQAKEDANVSEAGLQQAIAAQPDQGKDPEVVVEKKIESLPSDHDVIATKRKLSGLEDEAIAKKLKAEE
jgi:hypothetical protein